MDESPPEIAPVHKYPEKSPFSFELSLQGEGAERFGDLLVEVLELLELEALYRSLNLLLKK